MVGSISNCDILSLSNQKIRANNRYLYRYKSVRSSSITPLRHAAICEAYPLRKGNCSREGSFSDKPKSPSDCLYIIHLPPTVSKSVLLSLLVLTVQTKSFTENKLATGQFALRCLRWSRRRCFIIPMSFGIPPYRDQQ